MDHEDDDDARDAVIIWDADADLTKQYQVRWAHKQNQCNHPHDDDSYIFSSLLSTPHRLMYVYISTP